MPGARGGEDCVGGDIKRVILGHRLRLVQHRLLQIAVRLLLCIEFEVFFHFSVISQASEWPPQSRTMSAFVAATAAFTNCWHRAVARRTGRPIDIHALRVVRGPPLPPGCGPVVRSAACTPVPTALRCGGLAESRDRRALQRWRTRLLRGACGLGGQGWTVYRVRH
eukprot:scaffold29750_cov112-Isochrysis_galbana.AAC.2